MIELIFDLSSSIVDVTVRTRVPLKDVFCSHFCFSNDLFFYLNMVAHAFSCSLIDDVLDVW